MHRHLPCWGVLLLLALLAALCSLAAGQYALSFPQVIVGLLDAVGLPSGGTPLSPEQAAVLYHIRLPRTIVGLFVGAGLAVSGATLQGIFGNPLADPGIIGVSAGASVGAVLCIATGLAQAGLFALPLGAFLGALLAVSLTVVLSLRGGRIPVLMLLLAGVVVGMFLAAVTAAILTVASQEQLQQYLFWTIGGLDYRRWEHILLGLPPVAVGVTLMIVLARHLDILALGETEARAVGMAVVRYRMLFLALASLTTASGVCVSGNIGFVGLVVPHLLRLLLGPGHRLLLPACLFAGAAFLVFCDSLGRVIVPGLEIRVGIMTALIGTPYFLYLLRRHVSAG